MERSEITALAQAAYDGDRKALREFKALAQTSGYEGRPGGWIWFTRLDSTHPTCQGWQALAGRVLDARTILHPAVDVRVPMPLARSLALLEHVERGHDAANIVHGMDEVTCPNGHVGAPRTVAGTCAECEQPPAFTDPPRFPEGTPEYAAYKAELDVELAKFAKGEPPYEQVHAYATTRGGTAYPTMGGEPASTPREPAGRFSSKSAPVSQDARIEPAPLGDWNVYREGPHGFVGSFTDPHEALEALFTVTVVPAFDTLTPRPPHTLDDLERAREHEAWVRRVLAKREALTKAWQTMSDATIGKGLPSYVIMSVGAMASNAAQSVADWRPNVKRAEQHRQELEKRNGAAVA